MSKTNLQRLLGLMLFLALPTSMFAVDCGSVSFTVEQTLAGYPSYVDHLQTVDFDHDGKLDLVGGIDQGYPNYSALHTWRGVGDGTFEPAVSLGDTNLMDLQAINVNNDAYEDLVGVSGMSIWVRLGNATGFSAAIVTHTDYSIYDLRAGNFNEGTGNVDLVTSDLNYAKFVVYEGNGDGTFTEKRRVSVGDGNWVTDLTVADFDNDGRYDVALSRRMSTQLEVYFRNADGTFASPVTMSTGAWPEEILAADFNEDGLPDLVTDNWEDGTVDVFLNAGSRTFSAPLVFAGYPPGSGTGLDSLSAIDINGDSHLDILAGSVNGHWLSIYLGEGNGNFRSGSWVDLPSPDWAFSIAAGNFDGATDADLELALGSYQVLFAADFVCGSQVLLHSVASTITSGHPAKLRAVVSGISVDTPAPLGSVTFKEGPTTLGAASVGVDGKASLDSSGLALGDHTITAEFSGNATLGPATSAGILIRVVSRTTLTDVTPGVSTHGEPFLSFVSVRGQPSNNSIAGDYYLTLDGVTESAKRWSSGDLTLTLSAGPHSMSVEYLGNSYYPASESPTYDFTTAKHAVNMAKSGDTTLRAGTSHSIQITVSATTSPAPVGSVELFRGTTSVGTVALSSGIATFNITLPRGAYTYSAVYSGDTNYLTGSTGFTLNVLANEPLAIDAYGLDSTIAIPAVLPAGTTATAMYRRARYASTWFLVPSWTPASPFDDGGDLTRGLLYDYRLDATVSGNLQQSNIDSALLYTDNTLVAGVSSVRFEHLDELQSSINALRTMAGLAPFSFDGTFVAGNAILASHVTALRTAVTQARSALGMLAVTFTDGDLVSGMNIKRAHVTELRDAAR